MRTAFSEGKLTVLVGIRCTDGIVIGADSMATSAAGINPLMHLQSNNKIQVFENSVILAATGAVGLSQRLSHHVSAAIGAKVFANFNANDGLANISHRFMSDLTNSMHPSYPPVGIQFGALLACCIKGIPHLVEYDSVNFQPEIRRDKLFFVSMGSGQVLADPFLAFVVRVLWKNTMPSVEDGKFGVYWALSHTIKLAPGGVGAPLRIAVLREKDGRWCVEESVDSPEQAEYIDNLEEYIGRFSREGGGDDVAGQIPILGNTPA